MIAIVTRNIPFLKRQEIWFYNNTPIRLLGNNLFNHALTYPDNNKALNIQKVYTTSIDMTQPIEVIKSNLIPRTRTYINKGEKTLFEYFVLDVTDPKVQETILEQYNIFARGKNIPLLSKEMLKIYCQLENFMAFQIVFDKKPLVTHCYFINEERVCLKYTFPLPNLNDYDGQFRGLANRYLHWLDILYFKNKNYKIYDFGGISKERNSLCDFKTSFGGVTEEQFGYTIPTGVYAFLYSLKRKLNFFICL